MDVLLLNPKRYNGISYTIIPNIGLGHIAKTLRDDGHQSVIIDANRDDISPAAFKEIVARLHPCWVGITTFSPFIESVQQYARVVKNIDPKTKIVLGGPHPTFEPEQTFELVPQADFLVMGEGEIGMRELIKTATRKEADLSKVPNLAWKDDKGVTRLNDIHFIEDIDALGMPAWDLLEPHKFPLAPNGIFSRGASVAPVIATRGCPYPCTFCGAGKSMGKKLRSRSPKRVAEEMLLLKEKFGIEEIHFMDDNFTQNSDFVRRLCELLLKEGPRIPWACPNGIRLDRIDQELAILMERAGCYSLAIGIEFGTDKFLNKVKKSLSLKEIEQKVRMLKAVTNFRLTGFFILGHPQETAADISQTVKFSLMLPLDRANYFNFTPFPGSELYCQLKESGDLDRVDLEKMYIHSVAYHPPAISSTALARLQRNAHLRFYLRPKIIFGLLKEIRSWSQIKILLARVKGILTG